MTLWSTWLAVGGFGTLMTLAWLFIEKRLTVTTLLAAAAWGYCTLTARTVERVLETGQRVSTGDTTLQYFALALTLLSLLAAFLHKFGEYPPGQDDWTEQTQEV